MLSILYTLLLSFVSIQPSKPNEKKEEMKYHHPLKRSSLFQYRVNWQYSVHFMFCLMLFVYILLWVRSSGVCVQTSKLQGVFRVGHKTRAKQFCFIKSYHPKKKKYEKFFGIQNNDPLHNITSVTFRVFSHSLSNIFFFFD